MTGNFIAVTCKWFEKAAAKNQKKGSDKIWRRVQTPKDKTSHLRIQRVRPSFVVEGDDGVNAGGAAGGYRTGHPGDEEKADGDRHKGKPVAGAYAVK